MIPHKFPLWVVWSMVGSLAGMAFINARFTVVVVTSAVCFGFMLLLFSGAPGFVNKLRKK